MKKYQFEDERSFMRFVKIYLVVAAIVYATLAFTCVAKGEAQTSCGSAEQLTLKEYGEQYVEAYDRGLEAIAAAPPGYDFCVEPSFYTRACEACPMSVRWAGGPPGTCSSQAICGNHAASCVGLEGLHYPIIGQPGGNGFFDRYQKPADSAGQAVIDSWIDCYINHNDGPGNRQGCLTAVPLVGRLTYNVLTLAQVPPGPQKDAWCTLWHCEGTAGCSGGTPSPTPTAGPTPPPGVNPYAAWIEAFYADGITGGCATSPLRYCPKDVVTREQLAVFLEKVLHGSGFIPPPCAGIFADVGCANSNPLTITIGPMPTKTRTPHIGPAPTRTPTPRVGPN